MQGFSEEFVVQGVHMLFTETCFFFFITLKPGVE